MGRYFWAHGLHKVVSEIMRSVEEAALEGVRREWERERAELYPAEEEAVVFKKIDALFEDGGALAATERPRHWISQQPFFHGSEHVWDRCGDRGRGEDTNDAYSEEKNDRESEGYPDPSLPPLLVAPRPLVSKYPIAFHPHRTLEMGKYVMRDGVRIDKGGFSLRAVHHILRTRRLRCPEEICGDYQPRVFGSGAVEVSPVDGGGHSSGSAGPGTSAASSDKRTASLIDKHRACWRGAVVGADQHTGGEFELSSLMIEVTGEESGMNAALNQIELAAWILENCVGREDDPG